MLPARRVIDAFYRPAARTGRETFDARLRASVSEVVTRLRRAVQSGPGKLAGAAVVLAVVVVFAEAIFTPRVFYERDIHGYWYPARAVITRALAEGSLPLWNPHFGFGAPMLSDSSAQLAYPLTWLALLLPAALHYKLLAIGHTLLAAAGAWALARRLGLGRTAAMVAGASYALSGPLLSSVNLFHHHSGAAWIPWLLWALEGLLLGPSLRSALTLGVVAGAQILAGSGDMCLASAFLGTARIAWWWARLRTPRAARAWVVLRYGALAALLALALGAPQWLPTAELVRHSWRTRMDLRTASYWSLHPASLADLVVPRLVSDLPLSPGSRAALFEGRGPLLACVYLGIVPLAMGLLALVLRSAPAAVTAFGALVLVLLSLGRHTPLYWLAWNLPGFGLLRYPQKLLIPAALCVGLLAALGVEAWGRPWSQTERRRGRWAASVLVGCALVLAALTAGLASPPGWLAERLDAPGPYAGRDDTDPDAKAAAGLASPGARGAPGAGPRAERARRVARSARAPAAGRDRLRARRARHQQSRARGAARASAGRRRADRAGDAQPGDG